MASPRTRKPPEGGSAKGARKAPAGSVQVNPVAEAPPDAAESTPPSLKEALEVVARYGELTEANLYTLEDEELHALWRCVFDFKRGLAEEIAQAHAAGDDYAVREGWVTALGWLNMLFDLECTWKLHELPAEEAKTIRSQPVNSNTWRNLRARARWHSRTPRPRPERCDMPSLRRGQHVRQARRRNVRAGSRKARAPGSLEDDPDDLIRLAAASGRLWAHVRRREARQRQAWS